MKCPILSPLILTACMAFSFGHMAHAQDDNGNGDGDAPSRTTPSPLVPPPTQTDPTPDVDPTPAPEPEPTPAPEPEPTPAPEEITPIPSPTNGENGGEWPTTPVVKQPPVRSRPNAAVETSSNIFLPHSSIRGAKGTVEMVSSIERALDSARSFCGQLKSDQYTIDCLSDQFASIAASLPRSGKMADVRQVFRQTSKKLAAVANRNRASRAEMPRVHAAREGQLSNRTSRPLVPVRKSLQSRANAQAVAVLQEAQTQLLRSASSSASRKLHYQRIAAAIGSNKVLLRSL